MTTPTAPTSTLAASERKDLERFQRLARELFEPDCYQGDIAREDIDKLDEVDRMSLICITETVASLVMSGTSPLELAQRVNAEDSAPVPAP